MKAVANSRAPAAPVLLPARLLPPAHWRRQANQRPADRPDNDLDRGLVHRNSGNAGPRNFPWVPSRRVCWPAPFSRPVRDRRDPTARGAIVAAKFLFRSTRSTAQGPEGPFHNRRSALENLPATAWQGGCHFRPPKFAIFYGNCNVRIPDRDSY
jgi:hypothetical protein